MKKLSFEHCFMIVLALVLFFLNRTKLNNITSKVKCGCDEPVIQYAGEGTIENYGYESDDDIPLGI
jgi:hypothetical protein